MEGSIGIYGIPAKQRVAEAGYELTHWPAQKYARGVQHLDDARSLVRSWNLSGNAWIDWKLDDAGSTVEGFVRLESQPPTDEIALIVGDALHCFRGALDALVWELCWLDDEPATRYHKQIQFPFVETEKAWAALVAGPLATMPTEFQERIATYQPIEVKKDDSLLHWLFALNNQDKHRSSIKAVPAGGGFSLGIERVGEEGHPDAPPNGLKTDIHEPIEVRSGVHMVTTIIGMQVNLQRDRSPLHLDYLVEDGLGGAAQLGLLLNGFPRLAIELEYIYTGLRPPEPPPEAPPDNPAGS